MREDRGMEQGTSQRWAARTELGAEPNALSQAVDAVRGSGKPLLDLTVSNPTRCGFDYDVSGVLNALASPDCLQYDADPLGMRAAREAIAEGYYGVRGISADPTRLLLTSSTSEAYGYLLRLLCDPGDEVLVAQPSYPLFDLLARFHDVRLVPYPLLLHDDWRIDLHALRGAIGPRTRALVLVHPNNPTGHAVPDEERAAIEALAAEFGLALLVDEVFLDFPVEAKVPLRSFGAGPAPVLTFVLSGLSKVAALPQMKLAWTLLRGPEAVCREAMRRLEVIADTFLSPGAPVQHAVGAWLKGSAAMQRQIGARTRANLAVLDGVLAETPGVGDLCRRSAVQAGWSVLLRVPATVEDEALALWLVEAAGVLVHPGSFYGLPQRGWLVLSLLVLPDVFRAGVHRVVTGIAQSLTGAPDSTPL